MTERTIDPEKGIMLDGKSVKEILQELEKKTGLKALEDTWEVNNFDGLPKLFRSVCDVFAARVRNSHTVVDESVIHGLTQFSLIRQGDYFFVLYDYDQRASLTKKIEDLLEAYSLEDIYAVLKDVPLPPHKDENFDMVEEVMKARRKDKQEGNNNAGLHPVKPRPYRVKE
jgi:hypothetical protein